MYNYRHDLIINDQTAVKYVVCTHPSHNFPSMLYVPPREHVVHTCPACGLESHVVGTDYFMCNWSAVSPYGL